MPNRLFTPTGNAASERLVRQRRSGWIGLAAVGILAAGLSVLAILLTLVAVPKPVAATENLAR